jgi:hypothetical protein
MSPATTSNEFLMSFGASSSRFHEMRADEPVGSGHQNFCRHQTDTKAEAVAAALLAANGNEKFFYDKCAETSILPVRQAVNRACSCQYGEIKRV